MLPKMADLMAMLRNAVAEFGGDTPISKLPLDLDTAEGDSSSYTSTKLNPVYKRMPALTFIATEDGIVGGVLSARIDGEDDLRRKDMKELYRAKREGRPARIHQTGTDE